MPRKTPLAREMLNAVTSMRSDLGLFFENPPGAGEVGLRTGIYMLAVAVVGLAALFGPIALAILIALTVEWIGTAVGIDPRHYQWLGIAIFIAGLFVGLYAAPTVMYRITRRHSPVAELFGYNENTEAIEDAGPDADFEQGAAEPEVDAAWLRKVDARFAPRKPRKESRR